MGGIAAVHGVRSVHKGRGEGAWLQKLAYFIEEVA